MLSLFRSYGGRGAAFCSSALFVDEKTSSSSDMKWTVNEFGKSKDGVLLSRKIISPTDKHGLDLRLYQYQTCPYCSKVRAVLDYYGFSYEVVEVNPVTRSQLKFTNGYRKVPVLTSSKCDEHLVESSQIVSVLITYLVLSKESLKDVLNYYPKHESLDASSKPVVTYPNKYFVMRHDQKLTAEEMQNVREERQWREWVDDHFIHIISPNVYRTWSESLETFYYFDRVGEWKKNFPAWERCLAIYVGAAAMFMISKRLKKRHNIVDERRAMLDACKQFLEAKGPDREFLGGSEPNLADLAFYGAITSFAGCRTFAEMREQCDIGIWYDKVHQAVVEHRGAAKYPALS